MSKTPSEPGLSDPVTVRLPQPDLDSLNQLAVESGQKRSALIVEAVRCVLLLSDYGLDVDRLELLLDDRLDTRMVDILNALRRISRSLDDAQAIVHELL